MMSISSTSAAATPGGTTPAGPVHSSFTATGTCLLRMARCTCSTHEAAKKGAVKDDGYVVP